MRPKKPLLLPLLSLFQQKVNPLHEHHHGAVISILLDIEDYNVLIAFLINFLSNKCIFVVLLTVGFQLYSVACAARLPVMLCC